MDAVPKAVGVTPQRTGAPPFTGVSLDATALDRLLDSWEKLLKDFPSMKQKLLEDLGEELLGNVRQKIGGKTGKDTVQDWQERYLGSRNGYVAVRPKAKTYKETKSGKKYAVGYVTNVIEGGHRHRRPSQVKRDGYRYRPRIEHPAVPGKHFYAAVRAQLSGMGQREVAALAEKIARRLEGSES